MIFKKNRQKLYRTIRDIYLKKTITRRFWRLKELEPRKGFEIPFIYKDLSMS